MGKTFLTSCSKLEVCKAVYSTPRTNFQVVCTPLPGTALQNLSHWRTCLVLHTADSTVTMVLLDYTHAQGCAFLKHCKQLAFPLQPLPLMGPTTHTTSHPHSKEPLKTHPQQHCLHFLAAWLQLSLCGSRSSTCQWCQYVLRIKGSFVTDCFILWEKRNQNWVPLSRPAQRDQCKSFERAWGLLGEACVKLKVYGWAWSAAAAPCTCVCAWHMLFQKNKKWCVLTIISDLTG